MAEISLAHEVKIETAVRQSFKHSVVDELQETSLVEIDVLCGLC
jgi:hypothetical protein